MIIEEQEAKPREALTMDDDLVMIWKTYKRTNDYNLRNILIEIHMPLVRMIAERLLQPLPKSIELEDLTSAGTGESGGFATTIAYCALRASYTPDWLPAGTKALSRSSGS